MSDTELTRLMAEVRDTPLATDMNMTFGELWEAPGSEGWKNKPHRYLYDALHEALWWRAETLRWRKQAQDMADVVAGQKALRPGFMERCPTCDSINESLSLEDLE